MKLFVDDVRPIPEGWTGARTFGEALLYLCNYPVTDLSMDNDLGEKREGKDLLNFVEKWTALYSNYDPPTAITVHSSNDPARAYMEQTIQSIGRFLDERERRRAGAS